MTVHNLFLIIIMVASPSIITFMQSYIISTLKEVGLLVYLRAYNYVTLS